ncbi:MAG TPA: hypothetical protein VII98_09855 [Solirubrobacteraceae bacterium]
MARDPQAIKQAILDGVHEHGLVAGGEDVLLATVGAAITSASFTGDLRTETAETPLSLVNETATSGLSSRGQGEKLVAAGHTEGIYVVAVTQSSLYVFTTEGRQIDRVDARSGGWSQEPLGQTFAAWQPFDAAENEHPGILELGERSFLVDPGEGESAEAVAAAVQAARA